MTVNRISKTILMSHLALGCSYMKDAGIDIDTDLILSNISNNLEKKLISGDGTWNDDDTVIGNKKNNIFYISFVNQMSRFRTHPSAKYFLQLISCKNPFEAVEGIKGTKLFPELLEASKLLPSFDLKEFTDIEHVLRSLYERYLLILANSTMERIDKSNKNIAECPKPTDTKKKVKVKNDTKKKVEVKVEEAPYKEKIYFKRTVPTLKIPRYDEYDYMYRPKDRYLVKIETEEGIISLKLKLELDIEKVEDEIKRIIKKVIKYRNVNILSYEKYIPGPMNEKRMGRGTVVEIFSRDLPKDLIIPEPKPLELLPTIYNDKYK